MVKSNKPKLCKNCRYYWSWHFCGRDVHKTFDPLVGWKTIRSSYSIFKENTKGKCPHFKKKRLIDYIYDLSDHGTEIE